MESDPLREVIASLMARLGRLPTEDEVYVFVMGSQEERDQIWNKGA